MMRAALGLALSLTSSTAFAAGFYIADVGPRALGRGGAFVARADGLAAVHYNPSGLSTLRGLHFELSLARVGMDARHERTCPCLDPAHPDATRLDSTLLSGFNENPGVASTALYSPFLAVAYGFERWNATVAAFAYGPYGGRHDWGELPSTDKPSYARTAASLPTRYRVLTARTNELNFGGGFAAEPIEGLRVGFTAGGFLVWTRQKMVLAANFSSFQGQPEDPRFDIPVDFRVPPAAFFGWSVGASYDLTRDLTIGASFRGRRGVHADATLDVELPPFLIDAETGEALLGASIQGDRARMHTAIAPVGRLGLEYRLPGLGAAEVAFVYEGWSVHERIELFPRGVSIALDGQEFALDRIVFERDWHDAWSLRAGVELDGLTDWLVLRGGYFFETSAIRLERVDQARIDRPKHGVTFGASVAFGDFTADLGGTYVHLRGATITDSEVKQTAVLNPPLGSTEGVTTVGNGALSASYLVIGLGLRYAYDG